jgi:signal transduction histidine kinase
VLPFLVLIGFALSAVLVLFAINNATDRGVSALEDSLQAEVSAIAASQDQRISNTVTGVAGLTGRPFDLVPNSEIDRQFLQSILDLVPDLRSGFYLLDGEDRITQGVHLLDTEEAIGGQFEWPGFEALRQSEAYSRGVGGVLPVYDGVTTAEPVTAIVFPILDLATGGARGSFVFENVVAADSDFNVEISRLSRGETGQYLFLDSMGTVIAANDPSLIATPLDDPRYVEREPGLYRFDGMVVALADVPSAGWRVAFRQDSGEFEEDLAEPLQQVALIVVLVLLAAGAIFTFFLARRLRAAREEQERLQRINEAQEEFISIVSHELRTPVAGILGFLQTSLDHWEIMDDQERVDAVRRAATNARRLQALTRDVLDTQSVESGRLAYNFEPSDMADELRVAVEAARDLTPDRRYELTLPPGPVPVEIDSDRIQQVLTNLLDNAQKNSPAVEPVEIDLGLADGAATVAVRDHGSGFEPEAIDRMFEKFVRGRSDAVTGTGLGLYISRQIVEAHGGTISAVSRPGEGAEFVFTLPLRPAGDPHRAPTEAEPAAG